MRDSLKRAVVGTVAERPMRRMYAGWRAIVDLPPTADPHAVAKPVPTPALQTIELDYPVHPRPRWGWGQPPHPELTTIIGERRDDYADLLRRCVSHQADFRAISQHPTDDPTQPNWVNGWIPPLDTMVLYTELVRTNPRTYLEIGSGNSTKFARRAIRDHGLRTTVVNIDPHPRAECDQLCDEVIRQPAESVDLSVFDRLEEGDMVFLDGSHRIFPNSDTTMFFLDALPRLPRETLVQIHDIYLPCDYPPEWNDRYYSEQYPLATLLLARGADYITHAPNYYMSADPELSAILDPLWNDPHFSGVERHGGSYWLRRVGR